MEREIRINQLPVPTWHWLGMNETKIKLECMQEENHVHPEKIEDGITWKKEKSLEEIQTGMGKEFALLSQNTMETQVQTLHVKEGVKCQTPILLQYEKQSEASGIQRLQIIAEKESEVTVILVHHTKETDKAIGARLAHQTKVLAKEGAKVRVYQVQILDRKAQFLQDFGGKCEKNAEICLQQIELGTEKLYAGIMVELREEAGDFQGEIGYVAEKAEQIDLNYVARHLGRKTKSNLKVTGSMKEHARKLFRGTIDFQTGCSEAKGIEEENVLLFGEHMINQTIPLILCGEEDVEGSHGASIGQLDEQVLFYLQSRGFTTKEIEKMILRARMDALCKKIPSTEVQEQIERYMEENQRV